MKLHPPFKISPFLTPGLQVGDVWITINFAHRVGESFIPRLRYKYTIGNSKWCHEADDLQSGCNEVVGPASLQRGMATLLSFLTACAESRRYATRRYGDPMNGENSNLFPPHVGEWAEQHSDELAMLEYELNEHPGLLTDDE